MRGGGRFLTCEEGIQKAHRGGIDCVWQQPLFNFELM